MHALTRDDISPLLYRDGRYAAATEGPSST
jgi:hypothetical protein